MLATSRLVLALATCVVACPAVLAQAPCTLGRGLVLLDTAPRPDSLHVFHFFRSVTPEDTTGPGLEGYGGPADRTLLVYGPPSFYFAAPGEDVLPPYGRYSLGGGMIATFDQSSRYDQSWYNPLLRFGFEIAAREEAVGLIWVGEAGRWVRAVTNDTTGEALWVRRGRHVAAYTWAELFAAAANVERTQEYGGADVGQRYRQSVRAVPDDAAVEVSGGGQVGETLDCFDVEEVRGDWLRVQARECGRGRRGMPSSGWDPGYDPWASREETPGAGWIRWCRAEELMAWPTFEGGASGLIGAARVE